MDRHSPNDLKQSQQLLQICQSIEDQTAADLFRELVSDETVDVNAVNDTGETPLHVLCQNYNGDHLIELFKLLIDNGADINKANTHSNFNLGWTPLHYLLYYINHYQNNIDNLENVVHFFLQTGANVNAKTSGRWQGLTPLHFLGSCYQKKNLSDLFLLFVHSGAEVNAQGSINGGYVVTPLIMLLRYYRESNLMDLVQLYVKNGADPNINRHHNAPILASLLMYYEHDNLIDLVRFLIEKGEDVYAEKMGGCTPLSTLCMYYKNDNLIYIVILLIQNGANVNAKAGDGRTALHYVCQYYENDKLIMDIVRLLVENGGSLYEQNSFGDKPIDYLCQRGLAKPNSKFID